MDLCQIRFKMTRPSRRHSGCVSGGHGPWGKVSYFCLLRFSASCLEVQETLGLAEGKCFPKHEPWVCVGEALYTVVLEN